MAEACYLLADIGGTNARFAVTREGSALLECVSNFRCADYARLEDVLALYVRRVDEEFGLRPIIFCMAVAAPVHDDTITLTNHPWTFSRSALERDMNVPVRVLNDFSAQAFCLLQLSNDDLQWLQLPEVFSGVTETGGAARTIVGPGTGFGAATLTAGGEILESEPGHVSFAPVSVHEVSLLQQLWQRYPRVSVEHLLSGPGLANLYWANARISHGDQQQADARISAPEVVEQATQGDKLAGQTVQDFCAILGSVCGDIALSMGSRGGFYLSGGILEKLGDLFDRELFMTRFVAKGLFETWCGQIPVARLTLDYPGLAGCAVRAGLVMGDIGSPPRGAA